MWGRSSDVLAIYHPPQKKDRFRVFHVYKHTHQTPTCLGGEGCHTPTCLVCVFQSANLPASGVRRTVPVMRFTRETLRSGAVVCGEPAHVREVIREAGSRLCDGTPPSPHGGTRAVRHGRRSLLPLLLSLVALLPLLPLLPLVALGVLLLLPLVALGVLLLLVPATGIVGVSSASGVHDRGPERSRRTPPVPRSPRRIAGPRTPQRTAAARTPRRTAARSLRA